MTKQGTCDAFYPSMPKEDITKGSLSLGTQVLLRPLPTQEGSRKPPSLYPSRLMSSSLFVIPSLYVYVKLFLVMEMN